MKKYMGMILFALPVAALAAGPFDGTWVGDLSTATTEGKPDTYLVKDGMFTCGTCYPGLTIPADGKKHKVTGHAFYDEASATILGPNSVKVVNTREGKPALERTLTVSADGKTLTEDFKVYNEGKPSDAKNIYKRVKDAPSGSTNTLSGDWLNDPTAGAASADLLTETMQQTADGLKVSYPTGQSYDAKFDGKDYPLTNDPSGTTASIEKLGPRKIRETDKRKGQVASVFTYEVAADGKTMKVVDEEKLVGQTNKWTMNKQ